MTRTLALPRAAIHGLSRSRRLVVGLMAAGVLVAACGGDDSSSTTAPAPTDASDNTDAPNEPAGARVAFAYGFSGGGPETEFIAGLKCYASERGLPDPVVTYADADVSKHLSDFDSLIVRSNEIDGIFAIALDPVAIQPAYDKARAAGIFVVDPIGPDAEGNFATDADSHVAPDDPGLPQQIVDHIVANYPDASKLVVLSPPPGTPIAAERSAAFMAAAEAAGLEVVSELNLSQMTTEEAQTRLEDFLTSNRDIDVVFAQNGAMGRGAALAAGSQGVELAVLSLDADPATIEAVQAGEIDAAFGADLFAVAVKASEQVEALMDGGEFAYLTVPYTVYTQANAEIVPIDERCGS